MIKVEMINQLRIKCQSDTPDCSILHQITMVGYCFADLTTDNTCAYWLLKKFTMRSLGIRTQEEDFY
jgi:hypothetical protein